MCSRCSSTSGSPSLSERLQAKRLHVNHLSTLLEQLQGELMEAHTRAAYLREQRAAAAGAAAEKA